MMGNGDHQQLTGLAEVDQAERESPEQHAAGAGEVRTSVLRKRHYALARRFDHPDEVGTEPGELAIIVLHRSEELRLCGREERKIRHRSRARALANTSEAGMACTAPERYSSTLR